MKAPITGLLITALTSYQCSAQEMLGISNSNFAGQMGIYLNPSSIALAPYKNEIHAVSLDVFADNNYVYLRQNSGVLRHTITGETISKDRILDYYDQKKKRGYAGGHITGPAFIMIKPKYAWGAHLAWRSGNSGTDVPYHLAKFFYEGFSYSPQHNIRYTAGKWRAAAAGWLEIGGTYAKQLSATNEDESVWKAGITGTFNMGSYGIYINSKQIDYIVPASDLLIVNNWDVEYGHTLPNDREQIVREMFKIKGLGARGSLGVTYIRNLNRPAYDCYDAADGLKKYHYRLGFSLIDIGYFKNKADGTKKLIINNKSAYWPGIDTVKFLSWFYVDTITSNRFLGRPYASIAAKEFVMFTPAAASIQLDYCLAPRWYLNATVIHPIPFHYKVPRRPAQIAIIPRYEKRKFEVSMPVILFEFKNPTIGIAIRKGIFVIGTDRLPFYTGLFNSTGFDFFLGLKWQSCGKEFNKKRMKKGLCPV